jgi:hypothetical protein
MKYRITQIDGKYPNLALMKISAWLKVQGHEVFFERSVQRGLFEPEYAGVFGSAIFTTSLEKVAIFYCNFPDAIVGGSVWDTVEQDSQQRVISQNLRDQYGKNVLRLTNSVEKFFDIESFEFYDYSIYPKIDYSLGFMSRGCTQSCSHCGVPRKEGRVKSAALIADLIIQNPANKRMKFLAHDNDALNAPNWGENFDFLIKNDVRICYSQGINARLIDKRVAVDLARTKYQDDTFTRPRLHTAFDDIRDHDAFFSGLNHLIGAGIKPEHIMVYMLCNYDESLPSREEASEEIPEHVWYRFNEMVKIGVLPFPMIYHKWHASAKLKKFQEWVIRGAYRVTPFERFLTESKGEYYNRKALQPTLF